MSETDAPRGEGQVEKSDIHPQRVVVVAGIILVTLAMVAAVTWGLLRLWQVPVGAGPNGPKDFRNVGPGLQSAPQDERAAYFAEKDRLLHGYAWVDRQAGTARIPIEVAMALLAARGAGGVGPARPGGRP